MKRLITQLCKLSLLFILLLLKKVNAQEFYEFDKYKYVSVTKNLIKHPRPYYKNYLDTAALRLSNWYTERGIQIIDEANQNSRSSLEPCDIIYTDLELDLKSNGTVYFFLTARDCYSHIVFRDSAIRKLSNSVNWYSGINLTVDALLDQHKYYHYKYNSQSLSSTNTTKSQTTPVQKNTANTNQNNVVQPNTTMAAPVISDVDLNIPVGAKPNSNRFALIIGNEDYHSSQEGLQTEADVKFAAHDAATFKEYAIKVLGVPEDNLIFITNAKQLDMNRSIDKLSLLSKATGGEGEIFFYYAGHGFPDEKTKEAYIIPVDVSGADLKYALKLKDIYSTLTEYQSKRVTIFMDACFSGGAREAPLLANRGIKIKPKETALTGNEVVFCATSNDQTAMAYKAKGHGIFTYFLLKKLQETKGDIAYGELYESLQKQVGVKSILENSMEQTPTMVTAPGLGESWKDWRMR